MATTSGQTVNIQLSSQDAEGDARSTVRNVLERPISIFTSINSSTGLLSVTAPTGFVGTLQVRAMVAQAAAMMA